MGGIEVASVVASIISAFGNGMNIFHRLGGKKRKSRARLPRPSEEDEWLQQSLKFRPLEIRSQYDQQVAKFGRQFEVGDGAAHSSLAHTLLVLNTGLINLINHALSENSISRSNSHKALFNLSETAAMDTMTALSQLGSRLSLSSQPRLALEPKDHRRSDEKHVRRKDGKTNSSSLSKQPQRPPVSPLLVRGGWVRSKSGSSIVSGAAARRSSGGQEDRRHRSKSDSAVRKVTVSPSKQTTRPTETGSNSTDKSKVIRVQESKPSDRNSSNGPSKPRRQASMLIVPADFFENVEQAVDVAPPPRPPKIPLDSRPSPRSHKTRPTSTMTFMTASTKIGEIPESKWADRLLSPEEEESKRMPYTIPPSLDSSEPRRRKGLRFWKREDKRRDVIPC